MNLDYRNEIARLPRQRRAQQRAIDMPRNEISTAICRAVAGTNDLRSMISTKRAQPVR